MTKVLVTGAQGQLAQALAHAQAGYPSLEVSFKSKQELDITNLAQLHAYLSANPINYLVNCAAYTYVDRAEHENARAFAVNVQGPSYLASLAEKMGGYLATHFY
ncbi:MAG: sugar nucleotide-binding protein [Bacteroidota bacterium]